MSNIRYTLTSSALLAHGHLVSKCLVSLGPIVTSFTFFFLHQKKKNLMPKIIIIQWEKVITIIFVKVHFLHFWVAVSMVQQHAKYQVTDRYVYLMRMLNRIDL